MKKEIIEKLRKDFEDYAYIKDDIEYWFARDLQELLGYNKWQNFAKVINKSKITCKSSGQKIEDHFIDLSKMVKLGSDA